MKKKRGQVTIFIIIAIVIVGLAVLMYALSPRLGIGSFSEIKNPQDFIQTCIAYLNKQRHSSIVYDYQKILREKSNETLE